MILKTIYSIVPTAFLKKLRLNLLLSLVVQLLDCCSVVLLVPVIMGLFHHDSLSNFIPADWILRTSQNPLLLLAFVVFFFIVKNIIYIKIIRFQSEFYYDVSNSLSTTLLRDFLNKDLLSVKTAKNSALVKNIVYIPNNFTTYILSSAIQIISEILLLVLILAGCFMLNPLGSFVLLMVSAVLIAGLYFVGRSEIKSANRSMSEKYDKNFSHLLNAVNGFSEIKINRLENYFVEKFGHSNAGLNKIYSNLMSNRISKPKYTETFLILFIAVLLIISKYLSTENHLVFISFLFASSIKIVPSVNRVLIGMANFKSHLYTIGILQKIPNPKATIAETEVLFTHKIALQNISFSYGSKPLLSNVSMIIPKGKTIGIFGNSGNGKTTLINILATLIDADSGTILCDNVTIDNTNKTGFLKLLSYVPQAPFILEGSILENLRLGNACGSETINTYLKLFDLEEIIENLPQKLHTFIGSNGYALSGGQLQRIALIRALLRNPEILILDEATNQLDQTLKNKTANILKALSKENNLTVICISHHKNELDSFCDAVYELKNGTLTS